MTICNLTDMKKSQSGLVAKVESASKADAHAQILGWLQDFYRQELKALDAQNVRDYPPEKQGYHVYDKGKIVGEVKLQYFGPDERIDLGRRVRSHRFGIYFDYPNRSPNVRDKSRFQSYFKTFVVQTPPQELGDGRYMPPVKKVS